MKILKFFILSVVRRSFDRADALIGRRVKELRVGRSYAIEMIAGNLKVPVEYLRKAEAGKIRLSSGQIFSLGLILEVPVAHFFRSHGDVA